MIYTNLPGTTDKISKICLGTMTFGEQNSEKESHEQLDYAFDQGVNFIDTAELYAVPSSKDNHGRTEQFIGSWFAKTGKRKACFLATKVTGPSPNLSYIADNLGYSAERLDSAIEKSLKRLQTDYIDLYQLHWPERKTNYFSKRGYTHDVHDPWKNNFLDILGKLESHIQAGNIRYWGVSNETPWGLMKFIHLADNHNLPRPLTIQNPYSLLNRTFEIGLAEIAHRESVGLLAYSPLGFGLLTGKYHRGTDKPDSRLNKFPSMSRYNKPQSWEAARKYQEVADKHGLTLTQMALQFVNSRTFLTANIIGATSVKQLKENIDSIHVELSNECLKDIERVHESIPNPAP